MYKDFHHMHSFCKFRAALNYHSRQPVPGSYVFHGLFQIRAVRGICAVYLQELKLS